jgi:catechol 2,3-dioxygenase-like lactoylglutathione lyase family enzyme
MPKVTSLGHVGFYVRDIERSVAFYRDIVGLQVSDRSPKGAVFMTAQDRLAEHHELLLAPGRNDDGNVNVLQQISFHCASLRDVKDF